MALSLARGWSIVPAEANVGGSVATGMGVAVGRGGSVANEPGVWLASATGLDGFADDLLDGDSAPDATTPPTIATIRTMPTTTRSGPLEPRFGGAGGTPPATQGAVFVGGWPGVQGGVPAGWPVGDQPGVGGAPVGGHPGVLDAAAGGQAGVVGAAAGGQAGTDGGGVTGAAGDIQAGAASAGGGVTGAAGGIQAGAGGGVTGAAGDIQAGAGGSATGATSAGAASGA